MKLRFFVHVSALWILTFAAKADVRLPGIFRDHMVLQRHQPVSIWGWASPNEKVTVVFKEHTASATTNRLGRWEVQLPAMSEGGPFELAVEGHNRIVLSDILIGDVWICGGQSNMQWKISQTDFVEKDDEFLAANRVRLFTVDVTMDYQPKADVGGSGWKILTKENVADFSSVAYHFGKYLQNALNVPIGLISDNLGATSVETWMSNEALLGYPPFEKEILPLVKHKKSFAELEADFEKGKERWFKRFYYKGVGIDGQWFKPETDPTQWKDIKVPGNTWEAEAELKDHDGAVWFRTTFDLPEGYTQEDFLIQLGQIDDYDITWVNGEKAGETFGRHNHRNYRVATNKLKKTGNVLVVRVFDAGGIGGFTTNPFWAGSLLNGKWTFRKGEPLRDKKFWRPDLPNATPFSSPGVLFNGMIAPLTSFPIKGAIWYQGESNADRAYEYRTLFPAMIRDWRKHWGLGDFPFLFVQLANYLQEPQQPVESNWAELREAQAMALALPHTAMATAIDIGEANDIHPANKLEVGRRLALAGLKTAYGKDDLVSSGPVFKDMQIKKDQVRLFFEHRGAGLVTKDKYGYVRGFQVAGADKKFYWAQAFIEGDEVVVRSGKVQDPVAVRYAWADNPGSLDLYNQEGLPALPFRTDQWKGITEGKVFSDGPRF